MKGATDTESALWGILGQKGNKYSGKLHRNFVFPDRMSPGLRKCPEETAFLFSGKKEKQAYAKADDRKKSVLHCAKEEKNVIHLMENKRKNGKSAARHKNTEQYGKKSNLYGIRKEYLLKELPAIEKESTESLYFRNTRRFVLITVMRMPAFYAGSQETPLGVDIERLIHPTERLIRAVCHENEKMLLVIEDPAVQIRYFSKIWTAKESYLKCIGTGIRQKLSNLDLPKYPDGKTYEEVYHFSFWMEKIFSGGSPV